MKNMSLSPANERIPKPDASYRVPRKRERKHNVRNIPWKHQAFLYHMFPRAGSHMYCIKYHVHKGWTVLPGAEMQQLCLPALWRVYSLTRPELITTFSFFSLLEECFHWSSMVTFITFYFFIFWKSRNPWQSLALAQKKITNTTEMRLLKWDYEQHMLNQTISVCPNLGLRFGLA